MWDRILGTWLAVAGISLLFTFGKQYRFGARYAYLGLYAASFLMWGIALLREGTPIPRWAPWMVFALAVASMLADSVRRYRETYQERTSRQSSGNRQQGTSGPDA